MDIILNIYNIYLIINREIFFIYLLLLKQVGAIIIIINI